MTPWNWRIGLVMSAVGACVIAPCLASGLILISLGLPLSEFRPGIWNDYWRVLDQAAYRPYATRIALWGGAGMVLPPLLWCLGALMASRRRASARLASPFAPFDDLSRSTLALPTFRPGDIAVTKRHARTLGAPSRTSVLVSAPFHAEAHAVVVRTLTRAAGAVLVIDCGLRSHAHARAVNGRTDLRLGPFGNGRAWNPLAGAWSANGLRGEELRQLATLWFPDTGKRDRFIVSHVRNAFVSLVNVVDDVIRAAGDDAIPPAPGDVQQLFARAARYPSRRAFLMELAGRPEIGARSRHGLGEWLALDDAGIGLVWKRLGDGLALFADAAVDTGTRGKGLAGAPLRQTTVYLDIPDRWRMAAGPLIESAVRQWRAALDVGDPSMLVIHALDTLPAIAAITDARSRCPCLATTRGIAALHARYAGKALPLARRFPMVVVHAPRDESLAEQESRALTFHASAHRENDKPSSTPPSTRELMSLRTGEQIAWTPSLPTPVICRTLGLPGKPAALSPQTDQGEAMPMSRPLIAFLATLVATSARAGEPTAAATPAVPTPRNNLVGATIGSHRFMFPKNLYYQQAGPDSDGGVMLGVQWPSLEPLPQGVDYHNDPVNFISHINIDVSAAPRLSDPEYRKLLKRYIEPINPDDADARADPSRNLDLRIKGEPTHGLTPYLADFDKLRRYYDKIYGPDAPANDPTQNDDWYIRMGPDGIPTTVITCSSRFIPDGATIENGTIVDSKEGRRSTCSHSFLIAELRIVVDMTYLRVLMSDWQRIEASARTLIKSGKAK